MSWFGRKKVNFQELYLNFTRNPAVISLILGSIRDDQGILLSVYSGTLAIPKETPE